jgi:hypothetical protein
MKALLLLFAMFQWASGYDTQCSIVGIGLGLFNDIYANGATLNGWNGTWNAAKLPLHNMKMRYVQPSNTSIFISSIKFNSENQTLGSSFKVEADFKVYGVANISEFKFVGKCPAGLEDFLPVSITVEFLLNACPSITIQWIGICGENATVARKGLTGSLLKIKSDGVFIKDGSLITRPNYREKNADTRHVEQQNSAIGQH